MPSPIVYQKDAAINRGIEQFGSSLSSAISTFAESQKEMKKKELEKEQMTTLGNILSQQDIDLSTPEGIQKFGAEIASKGIKIDPLELIKLNQSALQNQFKKPIQSDYEKSQEKDAFKWITAQKELGFKANTLLNRLPDVEKAILSPELASQWDVTRIGKSLLSKTPIGEAVYNQPEQTIASFNKDLVTGLTELKNVRLTDQKLRWISGAVPSVGKTPEANKEALRIQKDLLTIQSMVPVVIDEIVKENGGIIPKDIRQQVSDRVANTIASYVESQESYKQLEKQDKQQKEYEQLPPPKDMKNVTIVDNETGIKYISDGKKWKKI